MAFNPDEFLAQKETPSFNPDEFLAQDKQSEEPIGPSELESGIRGAAQGISLGFADELTGAVETALQTAKNPSEITNILDNYRKFRDESRANYEAAQQANPKSYLAGELVGGVVPVLGTGGTAAGASLGKLALQGAKMGATYGAATGAGMSKSDLTEGDVGGLLKDTAIGATSGAVGGAVIGAAAPKVIEGISSAGKAITKPAIKLAEWIEENAPELFRTSIEAGRLSSEGIPLAGEAVRKQTVKDIEQKAAEFIDAADLVRSKSSKEIADVLGDKTEIGFGEQLVKYLKDVDSKLEKVGVNSDEGRQLSAIKASLESRKNQVLEKMGIDPTDKPYETVLKEFKKLKQLQTKSDSDAEAIAINKLYDRMVKTKGRWQPKELEINEIANEFNLQNPEEAMNLVRDVAKLKYNKQKITRDKDGEISKIEMVPSEFREIVQKYKPEIVEEGNIMRLKTAPGKYSKSEFFQPEVSKLDYNLTPQELMEFRKELRGLTIGKSDVVKGLGADIDKDITSAMLSKVPAEKKAQFDKAMEKYKQLYDLEELVGTQLQTPKKMVDGQLVKGEQRAEDVLAQQKVAKFIENEMGKLGQIDVNLPKDKINELVAKIPEFSKKWSTDAEKLATQKDIQNIIFKSSNIRPTGTWSSIGAIGGSLVGKTIRAIKKGASSTNSLANLDKVALQGIANVSKAKNLDKTAEFFTNLANTDNTQRKSALMFVASQNPNFKKEMDELFSDYPEED